MLLDTTHRRRLPLAVLAMLLLGALACNAPSAGAVPTVTQAAQQTLVVLPTTAPTYTLPPAGTDAPTPSAPPTTDPIFTGPALFNDQPSAAGAKTEFPTGTKEVWAIWNYANMRQGVIVKRVWNRDGELWVEREEPWDFAKYGASGTVTDISIFDRDKGLEPGIYDLHLFIDGVEQNVSAGEGPASFRISDSADQVFPGGADQVAILRGGGSLILNGADGQERVLARESEITSVQWFPDHQRILYVTLDRSAAPDGPTIDWKWQLWVIVIATGEKYSLSQADEQLHDPAISPQGDIIALVKGSGYGDAGFVDSELVFMYLDTSFKRNAVKEFTDFDGMPDGLGAVYPIPNGNHPLPGEWVGIAEFRAAMQSTFEAPDFNPGIYAFFTKEHIAQRIGDLPPQ